MTIHQILLILRLRWWLVLTIFVLVVAGAYGYSITRQKQYTAEATLLLESRTDPLLATLAPAFANPAYVATQVQIIRSDRVANRVVQMLGIAKDPKSIEDWREETQGRLPIENFYGELLQKRLEVAPAQGTNLVVLSFTGTDPRFAAAAANAFVRAYLELTVELRVEPARQYNTFYDERIKSLRSDFEAAQARLSSFQKEKGIVVSDDRFDLEMSKLNSIMQQLGAAQAEQADTSSRSRNAGTETSPDVQQSQVVQGLKAELARAETRMSEISNIVGSNHPQRIQLETQISQLKQQLASEMARVSGATATVNRTTGQKIGELKVMAEAQKRAVLSLRAVRDEMSVLQKDLETAQRAYEAVATRRSQLSLESQSDQATARVLSPAVEPLKHSRPNIPKNMAAAVIIGLVLGLAAVMGWEMLDRRVRSESDLAIAEGIPILGVLSPRGGDTRRGPYRPRGPLALPPPVGHSAPRLTLEEGR